MPQGKPALKDIIDAHFHHPGMEPGALTVVVRDRAAAAGTARLGGEGITGVHGGFIDLRDGGRVPLHRVVEVWSAGKRVWPPG